MAEFIITAPDGKKYKVTGETREGALAALQQKLGDTQMPAPREEIGNVGGLAANVTQGYLAGAGDEYMAGLSAILGLQPDGNGGANWFQYDKPLRERYGTALEAIRSEIGQYREDNPGKALAANVVGGIAGAATVAKAAPAALLPKAATTTTGKVAQIAADLHLTVRISLTHEREMAGAVAIAEGR